MADRPKRTLQQPKRFAYESYVTSPKHRKISKKDNNLYDIEIKEVDREKNLVRIHYKGYSDKYDEWRPYGGEDGYFPFVRQEKVPDMTDESGSDRGKLLINKLRRETKRKLYSSRKEDPNVRIEIDVYEDVYCAILANLTNGVMERGRLVYHLPSNRLLDSILGPKWDKRIFNCNGDFAYVVEGTVKFWLGKKSPITEYKIIGNGKLLTCVIEDTTQLVFTFVRGDGNRFQYEQTN